MIHIMIFVKNKNKEKGIKKMEEIIKKCQLPKNKITYKNYEEYELKREYNGEGVRISLIATNNYVQTRGKRYHIAYIDKDFTFREIQESIIPLNGGGLYKIADEQYF